MDDRLRETLSAMMDDQADELAVRRVLSHHDQPAVRDQWQRWQRIRDVIHETPYGDTGIDVRAAVHQRLAGDSQQQSPVTGADQRQTLRRRHAPWRWSAVAMITLGVAIGFGAGSGWDIVSPGDPGTLVPVQAQVPAATGSVPEVTLQALNQRQREQISRYLLEHAQYNSMGGGPGTLGYARVTSVSGQGY